MTSGLSDELETTWKASHDKAKVFDRLRQPGPLGDADARACLKRLFAAGSDDLWLSETLLDNGPEPLWPPTLIKDRVARAASGKWAAEPGDIGADLADPYGATPAPRVRAYFFPGRSERRALVIGGVHGNEPQGIDTVELLRAKLHSESAAGRPPFFTTIVVPTLFESTAKTGAREVPGGIGQTAAGKLQTSREVEPNRNFPLPGEDLAAAKARGAKGSKDAELVFRDGSGKVREAKDTAKQGNTSIRMLAENRILIGLIERLQPERIASVHSHSLKSTIGDAPGIFVDPRGIDPVTKAVTDQTAVDDDDRLTAAMVQTGASRWKAGGVKIPKTGKSSGNPFVGNAPGTAGATVRYASTATPEGNSLGTWAPVPTTKGSAGAAVTRPGITTVTVEVPQWNDPSQAPAVKAIEELDRDLLLEIFLGDPAKAVSSAGPTRPTTVP